MILLSLFTRVSLGVNTVTPLFGKHFDAKNGGFFLPNTISSFALSLNLSLVCSMTVQLKLLLIIVAPLKSTLRIHLSTVKADGSPPFSFTIYFLYFFLLTAAPLSSKQRTQTVP